MNWDEAAEWERDLAIFEQLKRIADALEANNKRIEDNESREERLAEYRARRKVGLYGI
jgi:hypothetical protein